VRGTGGAESEANRFDNDSDDDVDISLDFFKR